MRMRKGWRNDQGEHLGSTDSLSLSFAAARPGSLQEENVSLVFLKADMIKVQLDLVTRLFLVHTLPLATCSQGVELPLMCPIIQPQLPDPFPPPRSPSETHIPESESKVPASVHPLVPSALCCIPLLPPPTPCTLGAGSLLCLSSSFESQGV